MYINNLAEIINKPIGKMNFPNNTIYNDSFSQINNIRFYPYVGQNFPDSNKKILVMAYNIPCPLEIYESEQIRTSSKTHFADALGEFTYYQGWWTTTFRNFIKGSLGICENYTINSDISIKSKIDNFVNEISYANYINDLVPSDNPVNVIIETKLLERSHSINREIFKVLNTSHIVCWGKQVFNHILSQPDVKIISRVSNFCTIEGLNHKKGFEYAQISLGNQKIHLLKIFHPSMPSFGHKKKETHKIFDWFYKL